MKTKARNDAKTCIPQRTIHLVWVGDTFGSGFLAVNREREIWLQRHKINTVAQRKRQSFFTLRTEFFLHGFYNEDLYDLISNLQQRSCYAQQRVSWLILRVDLSIDDGVIPKII